MEYMVPERFRLYCRKGDALHVFRAAGRNVVCDEDGYRMASANLVAWYASDDGRVSLPDAATL